MSDTTVANLEQMVVLVDQVHNLYIGLANKKGITPKAQLKESDDWIAFSNLLSSAAKAEDDIRQKNSWKTRSTYRKAHGAVMSAGKAFVEKYVKELD
jgi:hypothetical protein